MNTYRGISRFISSPPLWRGIVHVGQAVTAGFLRKNGEYPFNSFLFCKNGEPEFLNMNEKDTRGAIYFLNL